MSHGVCPLRSLMSSIVAKFFDLIVCHEPKVHQAFESVYMSNMTRVKELHNEILSKPALTGGQLNRKNQIRMGLYCQACDAFNDQYMVTRDVWDKVKGDERFLCLSCVEGRLGRPLHISDFPDVPINQPVLWGYRMHGREKLERAKPSTLRCGPIVLESMGGKHYSWEGTMLKTPPEALAGTLEVQFITKTEQGTPFWVVRVSLLTEDTLFTHHKVYHCSVEEMDEVLLQHPAFVGHHETASVSNCPIYENYSSDWRPSDKDHQPMPFLRVGKYELRPSRSNCLYVTSGTGHNTRWGLRLRKTLPGWDVYFTFSEKLSDHTSRLVQIQTNLDSSDESAVLAGLSRQKLPEVREILKGMELL